MKKAFVLGMAFVTVVGSQAMAAGVLKDLSTYKGTVKSAMVSPKTGQVEQKNIEVIASKLNLKSDLLAKAMKDPAVSDKILMLASAKELASSRNDNSMAELVDATAALVSRKAMRIEVKDPKATDDKSIASLAIKKIEENAETMLTQFQNGERESYKKVLVEFDKQVSETNLLSYEERFIKAIEVSQGKNGQPISREKALEIARKLKDCV